MREHNRNFNHKSNTSQFDHTFHNTNNRLVIGRHLCVKLLGYVHLGLILICRGVSGFLQDDILTVIILLDMYFKIINRFLDTF